MKKSRFVILSILLTLLLTACTVDGSDGAPVQAATPQMLFFFTQN